MRRSLLNKQQKPKNYDFIYDTIFCRYNTNLRYIPARWVNVNPFREGTATHTKVNNLTLGELKEAMTYIKNQPVRKWIALTEKGVEDAYIAAIVISTIGALACIGTLASGIFSSSVGTTAGLGVGVAVGVTLALAFAFIYICTTCEQGRHYGPNFEKRSTQWKINRADAILDQLEELQKDPAINDNTPIIPALVEQEEKQLAKEKQKNLSTSSTHASSQEHLPQQSTRLEAYRMTFE